MRFHIVQGDESLTSHSGLALAGAILDRTALRERCQEIELPGHPSPIVSNGDVVAAMIGLLCLGKPDFDAVEPFRDDPFFARALGLDAVPSSPTLRQRLGQLAGEVDDLLRKESAAMVGTLAPVITPVHRDMVPLDIDVSPFDNSNTSKEGVSWTYKRFDGYAPIFSYVGGEGYLVDSELRPGSTHSQKGMPVFLRRTIHLSRKMTSAPLLVRLDSAHDSIDTIQVCQEEGAEYIIKRNLRGEDPDDWIRGAQSRGHREEPRPGKVVWTGEGSVKRPEMDEPLRLVFQVTERTLTPTGQALLYPEVKVDTFWTSLPDPPEKVIDLYRDHATSEQFHSEVKSDMDLERLPSGKFATNQLVLLLGMVAYNVLRLIGQESLRAGDAPLRKHVKRRRLRSVMQDMVYLASRVVRHARSLSLSFGRHCPWLITWRRVYLRFAPP
jgi:hypothetical protein